MTAKRKLPKIEDPQLQAKAASGQDAWRVLGIMSEFIEATARLREIRPAVSIFGSARTPVDHPVYAQTEKIARLLSDAGFSVISGGGPRRHGGRQQGRLLRQEPGRGAEYRAGPWNSTTTPTRTFPRLSATSFRASTCSCAWPRPMS